MPDNQCIVLVDIMLLCGDIHPHLPGPFQDSEKIATGDIKPSTDHTRKNRKHLMSVSHLTVRSVASRENLYLLKQTVTNNHFYIFTVSESGLDPIVYDADILCRHMRLSGKIEGHTGEALHYSSMLKTSTRPAWLKNGPQCLKPTTMVESAV